MASGSLSGAVVFFFVERERERGEVWEDFLTPGASYLRRSSSSTATEVRPRHAPFVTAPYSICGRTLRLKRSL